MSELSSMVVPPAAVRELLGGRKTHTHPVTDVVSVRTERSQPPPGFPAHPALPQDQAELPLPAVAHVTGDWLPDGCAQVAHGTHFRPGFEWRSHQICNQSFSPGARGTHLGFISYLLNENKWRLREMRCVRALPKVVHKVGTPAPGSPRYARAWQEGPGPVRWHGSEQMEKRGGPLSGIIKIFDVCSLSKS